MLCSIEMLRLRLNFVISWLRHWHLFRRRRTRSKSAKESLLCYRLAKLILRTTHPSIQVDCYEKYRAILLLSIDVSTHSIKTSLLSDTRHTVAHLKESTTCIRLLQAKCALPSSTPQPPLQASSAPTHKSYKKIAVITPTDMKAILPRVLQMGKISVFRRYVRKR